MIEFKNFTELYSEHLAWLKVEIPSRNDFVFAHHLYTQVTENGGWTRTIGLNNWEEITPMPNPQEFYEKYHLVSFEQNLNKAWNLGDTIF